MSKPIIALLCSSLVVIPAIAAEESSKVATPEAPAHIARLLPTASNPFFLASTLPYEYPPFDQIKNEDYAPAFAEGIRLQAIEVAAIANNTQAPTFDNTIVALERTGQLLERVQRVFFSMTSANTNPTLEALASDIAPKLSAHEDSINLNAKLFQRVKQLYQQRQKLGLDAESLRLLERYYTGFVRAGAKLNEANKTKLKAINAELASLSTQFSQNLLKETNASALVVENKSDLAGLSEAEIQAAANAAHKRGLEGKYVIALVNTSGQPLEASLQNREVRQKLYQASITRGSHGGEFDSSQIVLRTVKLRAERAKLLGYANHATYSLEEATAKTTKAVNQMLSSLAPAAIANATKEAADLQKKIDAEGSGFQLAAWDWAFYTEQMRKEKFSFDDAELRPYLELNNVYENGVFYAANQLYGISFKERKDLPVYDPTVRVYEVFDRDGKHLALFILDVYARDNKRGGAWMNAYVPQSGLFGQQAIVANHLNVQKPADGQPTLLTIDHVRTAFHEFGHALHGMFSHVKYPRFSGTAVPRDFVEYPSQVNEMWAVWPEVLKNYAKHYQTGEPIPQTLLDKVAASKKFNQGFTTTEYLAAAILDQSWHQLTPDNVPANVLEFESKTLKQASVNFAPIPPRYRSTYFSHIFSGGYSAGYYAYIWSEVLDADSVEWFKENGGLMRKNGDWFREQLLSRGGSIDPLVSFKNFRGREPDIKPLLIRRGLELQAK